MLLYLVSYLGGALTIASPCILPVLPFVFARADQSFRRSALPMLIGMGVTFAGVAVIASVGGGWVVSANEYGRWIALAALGLFGATLLSSALASRLMAPLVAAGNRLSGAAGARATVPGSFLLGVSTGLLWTPCAGPILGLTLTGAALSGASGHTLLLLLSYAAGAASSLALALLAGGRVFALMKRSLGAEEWIRRGLGVAVLVGVAAIAFGLDRGLLARLSLANTTQLEQQLLEQLGGQAQSAGEVVPAVASLGAGSGSGAQSEDLLPDLSGAVGWLNSAPLSAEQLRGKVVLVDFWTYSCINCLRALPYVRAWAEKYRDHGLVVIGVHTPEFAFEKNIDNVKRAVADLGVTYPVAIDNGFALWYGFKNQAWPAHYFVDAQGRIRRRHLGEGDYEESERTIQELLRERDGSAPTPASPPAGLVEVQATGSGAQADDASLGSPETYVGYQRAQNFASGEAVPDQPHAYQRPAELALNQWGLEGTWSVKPDRAVLGAAAGGIVYRFHARDLHLVLGPSAPGRSVRFRIRIDGAAPGADHGADASADGTGTVTQNRLYQLVRQTRGVQDRTFEIEFPDGGVEAFAFTFG